MILQALAQYYHRKTHNNSDIAPQGFEKKQIPFLIVIDKAGHFIELQDTRGTDKQTKKGRYFLTPLNETRSGKKAFEITNILWDHYGYVLAQPKIIDGASKLSDKDLTDKEEKAQIDATLQHQTFKRKVDQLHRYLPEDTGIAAVKAFLDNAAAIQQLKESTAFEACKKIKGCNLTFRLKGKTELVCQSVNVQRYVKEQIQTVKENSYESVCLISGERRPIARLHQPISGVNAKPAPFVSINLEAFESYGKSQGYGFPVSETAMFEYTTALNTLLKSDNCFRLGNVIRVVCWSDKPTAKETELPFLLNGGYIKDDPDSMIASVRKLFRSFHHGEYTNPDAKQTMYILGLSPNSARIVVRFWYQSTIAEISTNIAQWFKDIEIINSKTSPYPQYMPLLRLMCSLVFEGKIDNLPGNLVADTTTSILKNTPLPMTLLQMAVRRNRAEQSVTYGRVCLLRAYLNRRIRLKNTSHIYHKEISMAYDKNREDIGYILGALFSVLEKIQEDKVSANNGKINTTIKDRYFGAASSTPITVFAKLIKLSQHHLSSLAKISPGAKVNHEKNLLEIMAKIENFPSHLSMEQQGLFAIGYYQRRQDFFNKDDKNHL